MMTYETGIDAQSGRPLDMRLDEMDGDTLDRPRGARRKWIILGIVAAGLFLALLVYYLTHRGAAPAEDEAAADQVPTVSVVAPGRTTVAGEINATGTIAARRELPVGVVGEGGRVTSVPVDQGDWVRQGQVLAVIDRSVQNQQSQAAVA